MTARKKTSAKSAAKKFTKTTTAKKAAKTTTKTTTAKKAAKTTTKTTTAKKSTKATTKKTTPKKSGKATTEKTDAENATKDTSEKATAKQGFSSSAVHLGHIFALRPRVQTSFEPTQLQIAKVLLQDEDYPDIQAAARAVADKALELTHQGGSKKTRRGGKRGS